MQMQLAFAVAMASGPITSILFVSLLMNKYEDYFDQKSFYFSLLIGIFFGVFIGVTHTISAVSMVQGGYLTFVIVVSLITTVGVYIVLMMKRFREGRETGLYGLALGSGLGAMTSVTIPYRYLTAYLTLPSVITVWFFCFSTILVYSSMGLKLGLYINEKRNWYGLFMASMILIPFNALAMWWYIMIGVETGWEIVVMMVLYAGFVFFNARPQIFNALAPGKRKEYLRDKRKSSL